MSEENVEVVRRGFEVMNSIGRTGEFTDPENVAPDLWRRLDPEVELHERSDLPDAKVYRGPAEVKAFWRKTLEVWAEIRWEALEFVDLGHAVVVKAKIAAVGRGSDVSTELDATYVYWFARD